MRAALDRDAPLRAPSAGSWLALGLLAVTWLLATPAFAQPELVGKPLGAVKAEHAVNPDDDRDAILLNFEETDIREVIFTFASALGINYWIDPRVTGKVTTRSFGPIYIEDMFPVFQQILRSNGYALVHEGDLYKVIPAEDGSARKVIALKTRADGMENEQYVIDLVKVEHVDAQQVTNMLVPFVTDGGSVMAYPRNNLIVIAELSSNAARLRELIYTFDNDTFRDLNSKVYRIQHTSTDEIASELWSVLQGYHVVDTGSRVHIIPLMRLSAIAVIAFDPAVFDNVSHWLTVLDVPGDGVKRETFVYHVENAKAVELATVLNDVYKDLDKQLEKARKSGLTATDTEVKKEDLKQDDDFLYQAASGGGGGGDKDKGKGKGKGGGGKGKEAKMPQMPTNPSALVFPGLASGAAEVAMIAGRVFEQEVRIVADPTTNSLVVLATPQDYSRIKKVLKELDTVPRQVLVEMTIAEVTLGDDLNFGVTQQLLGNTASNGGTGNNENTADDKGGAQLGELGLDDLLRLTGGGPDPITGGLLGQFSFFRGDVEVYRGVLSALAAHSKLKILSRPHIMTADNQEARILVGAEIPIITSQADTNVTSDGQSRFLQTVEYRDTGVVISVTPQVNSNGLVNMLVSQEVSEIAGDTSGLNVEGISSPSFTTREAHTDVIVRSGETIVIGGIMQETSRESRVGIPYLEDIPFFGQFFRTDTSGVDRTELIVLITPYVVRDHLEARSVTEEFKGRVDDLFEELNIDEKSGDKAESHTVILPKT
jgi:general secretion pathway protein D